MTSHAPTIRQWFGLAKRRATNRSSAKLDLPVLSPGHICLITGPSGAGKSRLLRRLVGGMDDSIATVWPDRIKLPDRAVIDCFGSASLTETLRLLGRCGLAEAWTYLRRPARLSEGERWRLRLAMALALDASVNRRRVLVMDEFAAVLDRVTAAVVSRSLRRIVSETPGLSAICATSHEDLTDALGAEVHVVCDFGRVEILP